MEIGDRVLVKILAQDGKHKLSDKWAEEVYIVLDQQNSDIPVYKVKREDGHGGVKILYRNHLLHLGQNSLEKCGFQNKPDADIGKSIVEEEKNISDNQNKDTNQNVDKDITKPIPKPRKRVRQKPKLIERDNDDSSEDEFVVTETTTQIRGHNVEADNTFARIVLDEKSISEHLDIADGDPMIDEAAHQSDYQHELQFHDRFVDTEDKSENETVNQIDTEVGASDQQRSDGQTERTQENSENVPIRPARVRKIPAWQDLESFV